MRARLSTLMVAAALAGVASCDEVSFPTAPTEDFQATLAGANETPPVTSTASGLAVFSVTLDTFLAWRLDVATIDSTTAAHIHVGAAGVPGAILVTLFAGPTAACTATSTSPRCRVGFTGALAQGQFVPSQLMTQLPAGFGTTARERFDSLVVLMRNGGAYVNVHTVANSGGEIRGQTQVQAVPLVERNIRSGGEDQ